ncbi:phage tail protein [Vibrio fluvialis]|uniref:phage tail protein n=1 Tax=Vibrio fluvialis TaxID=676 RepID=UPI00192BB7C1|nr:phage tail protein [Vibrio fluvialis]EKO3497129.1 phage tail protein [Vibrio fluvialis]EKO4003692.1 phage tail protein [Vibrio fluvialis]MBL4276317.1 phage tail protein [Vibrio fluvialis]
MSEQNNGFVSAQPESRTLIEEALEYAWDQVLAHQENPYPDLKNPELTPDEFVVLLAAERGVADWQPGDSETQQRKTTANAFAIHSKAGTRYGLKGALEALGFTSSVVRGEQPYSISVEGRLDEQPLTAEISQRINSRVMTYKSERDTSNITLSRLQSGKKYRGLLLQSARIVRVIAAEPVPPLYVMDNPRSIALYSVKSVRIKHG